MPSVTLTAAQQRRIAKLAALAGRTPKSMLRFVLHDGLDATERDVRETIEADRDMDRNGTIPHRGVMMQARATVSRRKELIDFFRTSPLVGVELNTTRTRDAGRRIDPWPA